MCSKMADDEDPDQIKKYGLTLLRCNVFAQACLAVYGLITYLRHAKMYVQLYDFSSTI